MRHFRTEKLGIEVSAFYPVTKNNQIPYSTPLYVDENKAMEIWQNIFVELSGSPSLPGFVKPMINIKTDMVFEGEVCEQLSNDENGLRPVIFSHGLMG